LWEGGTTRKHNLPEEKWFNQRGKNSKQNNSQGKITEQQLTLVLGFEMGKEGQ